MPQPRTSLHAAATITLAATSLLATAPSCPAGFTTGDLFLVGTAIPNHPTGGGGMGPTVLRINPGGTWASSSVATFPANQPHGRAVYDPFRDRIVLGFDSVGTTFGPMRLLASDGTVTAMSAPGGGYPAATGDGRIYFLATSPAGIFALQYFDSAGNVHPVMDPTGASPYILDHPGIGGQPSAMCYHPGTSSLIVADSNVVQTNTTRLAFFRKLPLTPEGDRLSGPEVTATFTPQPQPGQNGHVVTSLGRGPGGTVFFKIDNNDNSLTTRLGLLDPVAMTTQGYASSNYFGCAGETAGAFVPGVNAAVTLDTGADVLRLFTQGTSGAGTILPTTGVSQAGFSGDTAQLVVITPPVCTADLTGDEVVNTADLTVLLASFGKCPGDAGYNTAAGALSPGSPCVNTADLTVLLVQFGCGG